MNGCMKRIKIVHNEPVCSFASEWLTPVYGNRGTLRTLRNWGFVTFDNLWDESYDEIVDTQQRADTVAELLSVITIKNHDAETLRRLQHNRDHFFDRTLVEKGIVQEIIEPIINYAETH